MHNHEYNYDYPAEKLRFKLHSPYLASFERLRAAERIINAPTATDQDKLHALFELFSPHAYQFNVCKIKTQEEPV